MSFTCSTYKPHVLDLFQPTDVFLPSGKQYLFHRDASGRLQFVETMVLGHHHFRTLLTIGRLRQLYTAPGMTQAYVRDYDTNGKLLQVLFPSQQRRVIFRYNHHFQVGGCVDGYTDRALVFLLPVGGGRQ